MKIHRYYQRNKYVRLAIRAYIRLFKLSGHPREIALGFALGILVGMTPLMGIQMTIAAFLASLLGWNPISAAMGVWITNPVTAPAVYGVTYLLGANVLQRLTNIYFPPRLYWRDMMKILHASPQIFLALFVGGMLIGVPLAILSYYVVYFATIEYRSVVKVKIAARLAKLRERRHHRHHKHTGEEKEAQDDRKRMENQEDPN